MGLTGGVLAVDAGNSKTDVAVVTAEGEVLATARGGPFRPHAVGVEQAVDALAEAVARAFAAAGVTSVAHVSACLANADLPVEEEQLAAALDARAWGARVDVRNDTFAILRAGVAEPLGVAVVCGAGVNCVGMRPTELARTLPAHFGLGSMYALIEALHLRHVEPARRHELTPVLFATAAGGDPLARSVVDRQADEVVAMAAVALTRLDLLAEPVPVLLGGSVLAARHPQLDERIRELLAARAPKAVPRVVTERPVLGAVLLGLDAVGAAPGSHARVREHFAGA
ncbi:N-acetylglucosamine kinase [Streptomyces olivaceus]|uniref:N-acetylglucosamine kinase n=1 Tax=Streptomyces olivaceus TaxID=47716 RepID=UPI0040563836